MSLARCLLVSCALLLAAAAAAAAEFTYAWGHPRPQGDAVFGLAFADAQLGWAVGGGGEVLATADGGEHWTLLHQPGTVAAALYDVVVTPAGTLVAGGAGPALLRSTDGGATWQAPAHAPIAAVRDLCLVPGGAISAAGEGGVVLVSDDDGLTWDEVGPGAGTIRHHVWRTASEGYVVGQGVVHRTTDGGAHWTPFAGDSPFGHNEVFFVDDLHGFVVEDFGYWETVDGGANWQQHDVFTPPLYRYRTLVLSPTHWLTVCHGEGGELYETTNAGADWQQRYWSETVGFPCLVQAPGGRVFFGSDAGDLYWTDDDGATLGNAVDNLAADAIAAPINLLVARADGVLFAANQPNSVQNESSWLRSDDGGTTWTAPAERPGNHWVNAGAFADALHGVTGAYGDVWATFDGGGTWQDATLPGAYQVIALAAPAADRYFAACYVQAGGGAVLGSDDGGLTWEPVAGGLPVGPVSFWVIDFPTPLTGFAAGTTAALQSRLYRTDDGGATWSLVDAEGLDGTLRAMAWFDGQRGIAATTHPVPAMRYTVDGGLTWDVADAPSRTTIVTRGDAEAVALDYWGTSVLHSTDGGATWQEVQPPLSGAFPGQHEYLVAAAATDDGWVLGCGRNKLVTMTALPSTPVGGGDAPAPLASQIRATPNPFNPTTRIAFTLERPGAARVELHDARGRRVRTLAAGDLAPGRHEVTWDGRDAAGRAAAAGVYLARLVTSSGETAVAKLVLAK